MRRAVKRSSKRLRMASRESCGSRSTARAARHRLDRHQPEGLRPVDRHEERDRAAQEWRFLGVADLADVLDMGLRHERPDLLLEIVLIDAVHLGRDLEGNSAMSGDADRAVDALLRRD